MSSVLVRALTEKGFLTHHTHLPGFAAYQGYTGLHLLNVIESSDDTETCLLIRINRVHSMIEIPYST